MPFPLSEHSGSHSSAEKLLTPMVQPRPSEPSAGNLGSILEDEKSVGLRPKAQCPSDPPQSFEDAREHILDGGKFKDSPSRIILHNDGSAAFYALLLSEDLAAKQRETLEYCRKRSRLNRKLRAVRIEYRIIEGNLNYANETIEETSSGKRSTAEKDLELEQQRFLAVCQKKDVLERDLHSLERNLEYVRAESQGIFEEILRKADMLNLPDLDDDSITSIHNPTEHDQSLVAVSVRSSSTDISVEHTFRLALLEEMGEKRMKFHIMQDAFDQRNQDLEKDHEEYEKDFQDGNCSLSQSDYDCMGLEMLQARTRNYIDAEIAYEEVKTRARALGLLDNEFEQESNFIDYQDDGYRESHEAAMTATINEDGIEEWKAQIINSRT